MTCEFVQILRKFMDSLGTMLFGIISKLDQERDSSMNCLTGVTVHFHPCEILLDAICNP
jgi:hypothetical protein